MKKENKKDAFDLEVKAVTITELDEDSDVNELLASKKNAFILQFDTENNKCFFVCKQYNINEVWDYTEGEEDVLTEKALGIIKEKAKKTFLLNSIMLLFIAVVLIGGVYTAVLHFIDKMYANAILSLSQVVFVLMCLASPFVKKINKTVLGVFSFIISWICFYTHSFILGILYVTLGRLYILDTQE